MKKIITLLVFILFFIKSNAQCFKTISTGESYTIAIKTNGTLWTWGSNQQGQLGDGTIANRSLPTQIGTATNWQSVSAGDIHALAIKTDGTLWAWGNNQYGQLGNNTTVSSMFPIQIGTATNWESVSAGSLFSLALKTDGTLWAWGDNFYKQLGLGSLVPGQLIPTQVGTDSDWYLISAGANHSLAVKLSGPLYSWGSNSHGQLGLSGSVGGVAPLPVLVNSSVPWKSISAGGSHNIALKDDNTLWAWGNNGAGQLGNNSTTISTTPIQIGTDTNWSIAEAGSNTSFAIKATATLWVWGQNNYGQLGDNTIIEKHLPTQLGTATNWAIVAAGGSHVVAQRIANIFNTNTYSWGFNQYGQLGDGTLVEKHIPTLINNCSTLETENFTQNQFKVYPNPANNVITIQNNENLKIDNLAIFDISGKKILEENQNTTSINIQSLQLGMYFLEISADGKTSNYKFIKQ